LCIALIDSGASHSFASKRFCHSHRLGFSHASSEVAVADGRSVPIVGVLRFAAIRLHAFRFKQDLLVVDMPDHDVVLGMDFLHTHAPKICFRKRCMTLIDYNARSFTLLARVESSTDPV
jgi:hypothetical protein